MQSNGDQQQLFQSASNELVSLGDVTPEQREAIEHVEGPMLVLAGAGSGKTRVITRRIARLIEKGTPGRSILSITFTNKAAGEMGERVRQLIPGEFPWVSTFHSFCARLLREDIVRIGYERSFTIFDESDSQTTVKEALREVGAPDTIKPAAAKAAISRWKSGLVGPDEAFAQAHGAVRGRKIAEAFKIYVRRLKEQNALDFDDLLLKALELLRLSEEARSKWQSRFNFIQVDEYQDTNKIQFELVKLLCKTRNVTVVGDPDQSIYSWRGADPKNIDDFLHHYKDTRIVKLASNFRSKQAILDAASALISHSVGIRAGELKGVRGTGEPASLFTTENETHESREVAKRIGSFVRSGVSPRDIAVFYRTNAQSRAIEEAMIRSGTPYTLVGSVAFYQRREVKDAMTYLRVAQNRADDVGFKRIVNTPRRGIGNAALAVLAAGSRDEGLSLGQAIQNGELLSSLSKRAAKSLSGLNELLNGLGELADGPAGPVVKMAVQDSGLRAMYKAQEETERVENLDELTSAASEYDAQHPGEGLTGFLERAALISDLDMWDKEPDRVTLMTMHAAKGLEFKIVFITGLEDGLLPHIRSINDDDPAGLDEERRLLYVGMTRAEDRLYLSCARARRQGGQAQMRVRSRFLDNIPSSLLFVEAPRVESEEWHSQARPGMTQRYQQRDSSVIKRDSDDDVEAEARAIRRALADMDDHEGDCEVDIGDRVRHAKFGVGKVAAIKGSGGQAKITVDFSSVGRKVLAAEFARLSRA